MSVWEFALSNLKKEYKKNIGYGIILLAAILISFIFNTLILNSDLVSNDIATGGGSWKQVSVPISTGLPFVIVCFSWIMILYASNYLISKKNQEIALIINSGGSFIDVTKYIVIQVLIILCIATPIALIIGGFISEKMYQGIYEYLNISIVPNINYIGSYLNTIGELVPLIIFVGISVAGFSHRNSILDILGRSEASYPHTIKSKSKKTIISVILYILGIVMIFSQSHGLLSYIFPVFIGIVGIYGIVKKGLPRLFKRIINLKGIEYKNILVSLSNCGVDIEGTTVLISFIIALASAIIPILVSQPVVSNEFVTGLISYFVLVFMLALSIVFKLALYFPVRKQEFINMNKIGYTRKDIKKIIFQEMFILYTTILILPLPYVLIIGIRFVIYDNLSNNLLIIIITIFASFLIMSMIIAYIMYRKTTLTNWRLETNE